jgi:heterodisulfide reductase subunit C
VQSIASRPTVALRSQILISTGQDVRLCASCAQCDRYVCTGMDLTLGEVIRAAARDDLRALDNQTIWACEEILDRQPRCQAGLDLGAILLVLQRQAVAHGLGPFPQAAPEVRE